MDVSLIDTLFRNKMSKFYNGRGYPPSDCVIPYWMYSELKENCEKILGGKLSQNKFEYLGVTLHPCCNEMEMYFYKAFKGRE